MFATDKSFDDRLEGKRERWRDRGTRWRDRGTRWREVVSDRGALTNFLEGPVVLVLPFFYVAISRGWKVVLLIRPKSFLCVY